MTSYLLSQLVSLVIAIDCSERPPKMPYQRK